MHISSDTAGLWAGHDVPAKKCISVVLKTLFSFECVV